MLDILNALPRACTYTNFECFEHAQQPPWCMLLYRIQSHELPLDWPRTENPAIGEVELLSVYVAVGCVFKQYASSAIRIKQASEYAPCNWILGGCILSDVTSPLVVAKPPM